MKLALYFDGQKEKSLALAAEIRSYLKKKDVKSVLNLEEAPDEYFDCVVSLGGDGSILHLLHSYPDLQAPLLGINLGHLGFMAEVPLEDLFSSLDDLLEGLYHIEERIMIEGEGPKGKKCFAFNDMVLHRAKIPQLVEFSIYVDGSYFNTFAADGVILSTPSGSTAYSLAAGGPILSPDLDAFVLTPICPHTISNRPIVFMPKDRVEIRYLSKCPPIEISFDGVFRDHLNSSESFIMRKASKKVRLLRLNKSDYFSILRSKLSWTGGKIRESVHIF